MQNAHFNPAAVRTHQAVSDDIEVEKFSLNSAETFTAFMDISKFSNNKSLITFS